MNSKQYSDRIKTVTLLAQQVFEDEKTASEWMDAPNFALNNQSPTMHCETEIGAQQVRKILNAIEWGGVV